MAQNTNIRLSPKSRLERMTFCLYKTFNLPECLRTTKDLFPCLNTLTPILNNLVDFYAKFKIKFCQIGVRKFPLDFYLELIFFYLPIMRQTIAIISNTQGVFSTKLNAHKVLVLFNFIN